MDPTANARAAGSSDTSLARGGVSDPSNTSGTQAAARLSNISPQGGFVEQLLKAKFTSAAQIASINVESFSQSVPDIPRDAATQIHQNAVAVVHRNEIMLASVAPALAAEVKSVSSGMKGTEKKDSNLDTIFDNLTTTSCGHCCSVLSPSAYLVELLEFLGETSEKTNTDSKLPRDELLTRRPDIGRLELSCANTNTEFPYVDLVNEILESYLYYTRVHPSSSEHPPLDVYNHQDGIRGPEDYSEPQNINNAVYELLRADAAPIGLLPFDRHLEQVRVLFDKSGTSRSQFLELFGDQSSPEYQRALVAEELGLTEAEYIAITREPFSPGDVENPLKVLDLHHYWGFESETDMMNPYDGISRIKSQFLPRTGYTYDQLIDLLRTEFINGPELPREILGAPKDLSSLWSQVKWETDDSDIGTKYGELLSTLTGKDLLEMTEANHALAEKLVSEFIRVPTLVTISLLSDNGASSNSSSSTQSPSARWWMKGGLHYGTEDELRQGNSTPFAYVYEAGDIASSISMSYTGHVDEQGQFILRGNLPLYSLDEFSDPDKHCWIVDKDYGLVGKLLRSGSFNGDLLNISDGGQYLSRGPESASKTSGWVFKPFEQKGEPSPSLMAIRQLNGQPLSLQQWERIHGFVRLQKKMGWTIAQTDTVLGALGATRVSPEVMEMLALVQKLRKSSKMSLSQALILTQGLSLKQYKDLFLKPGVLKGYSIFALNDLGRPQFEYEGELRRLSLYCVPIAAALGPSPAEIMGVIVALGLQETVLSMNSISTVYQHIILCREAKQPLSRLSHMLRTFGRDPFESNNSLQAFLHLWTGLSQYSAIPEDWEFIFRGNDASGRLAPPPEGIFRIGIQMALANAVPVAGLSFTDDTLAIISNTFNELSPELIRIILSRADFANPGSNEGMMVYFVPPTTGFYRISQGPTVDEPTDDGTLPDAPPPKTPLKLGSFYSLVGGRAYLVSSSSAEGLLMSLKDKGLGTNVETSIPAACLLSWVDFQIASQILSLLSRYDLFFAKTNIPPEDAEYVLDYCHIAIDRHVPVAEIETFLTYDLLRQQCTSAEDLATLLRQTGPISIGVAAAALANITGWNEMITSSLLIESQGTSEASRDTRISITVEDLGKLAAAYDVAARTGLSNPSRLYSWARTRGSSQEAAIGLRDAMRAQVDDATWETRSKSLFDPLRRASRDALVAACVKQKPQLRDADGLFEHFLIDVSMGTCLKTSRIKQAISSIQIFVQRCLLGLEPQVKATAINRTKWDWMISYDLWQVNRRIVLYPENWLEPTLRDNKSSVFKAIEASFSQGSVTLNDAIEAYVAGMLEVANLEVIALRSGKTKDHIIARTRLSPHKFYYRTYVRRTGCWTPWELLPVELPTIQLTRTWEEPPSFHYQFGLDMKTVRGRSEEDINAYLAEHPSRPICSGSYLRIAPFNGSDERLILFIPTLTPRSYLVPDNPLKDPNRVAGTKYYWEVGMSFSERKNGIWSPRVTATDVIITHVSFNDTPRDGPESNSEGLFPFPRLRDTPIDQHLVREGSFHFIDRVDDKGRLAVWVYLEIIVVTSASILQNRNPETSPKAVFVGEFVYDNGQIRRGETKKSNKYNEKPDYRLTPSPAMVFQGTPPVFGQRRWRVIYGTKSSPYDSDERRLMVDDRGMDPLIQPSTNTQDELESQKQLWNGVTLIQPDQDQGKVPITVLSNNLAEAFQNLIARGEHRKVIEYFNQVKWHIPELLSMGTNAKLQGLGRASTDEWYHELHTPVALYNWELCVHLPMLLASKFASTQQLDEALDTIKMVFDPTVSLNDKTLVWRFAPFREATADGILNTSAASARESEELKDLPFNPFAIARQRIVAYMRWFAYKYIEVLTAKGDMYFRRFTLESISLAIQCYVEASQVFGPRPQTIQSAGRRTSHSYSSLRDTRDGWGPANETKNPLVSLETLFPFHLASPSEPSSNFQPRVNIFGSLVTQYFCVPANSMLTDLRATIDDRLFKIRSCRDIEGNVRSLLLWEPPLDPGAVLRALGNGIPIGSVADKVMGSSANFRFKHLIKIAFKLCAEVQRLGTSLLKLRESKDVSLLEALRASQQRVVTERLRDIVDQEIEEAEQTLSLIEGNISDATDRMKLYLQLIGEDLSKVPTDSNFTPLEYSIGHRVKHYGSPMSKNQRDIISLTLSSINLKRAVPALKAAASMISKMPDLWQSTGALPGVVFTTTMVGGSDLADGLERAAGVMEAIADVPAETAEYISLWRDIEVEHLENQIQANEAGKEISGYYVEAAAQRARLEQVKMKRRMKEEQLTLHDDMDKFLRTKYTNADLYTWSINSLQKLYYESYNQALDVASQAEWAFRFERGDPSNSSRAESVAGGASSETFIKAGYWNASYDGLLAGESLTAALHRLQAAYVAARAHDYEITRVVSLRQVTPAALLHLRSPTSASTGSFNLPETLWDMDFPGHYNRRIRSVKLRVLTSQVAVASLNVTLTLLNHRFRFTSNVSDGYAEAEDGDPRFFTYAVPITSVAVSSPQLSAGVFELDFSSERYMPFEGAGLISQWSLSLNSQFPSFDYSTIQDVELEFQYTSRGTPGSGDLAALAIGNVQSYVETAAAASIDFGLGIAIDPCVDLTTQWTEFQKTDKLAIPSSAFIASLPFFARLRPLSVVGVRLEAEFAKSVKAKALGAVLTANAVQPGTEFDLLPKRTSELAKSDERNVESMAIVWTFAELQKGATKWEIAVPKGTAKNFKRLLVIIGYTLQ